MKNKLLLTLTLITPLTTQPFLEEAPRETLELLVQAAGATAVVLGVWGTAEYIQKSSAQAECAALKTRKEDLERHIRYQNQRYATLQQEQRDLSNSKDQLQREFEQFKALAGMSKNDELLRQELWEHRRTFPTLWTILNQTENPNATLNDLIQSAKNLRTSKSQAINNATAWSQECSSLKSTLAAERSAAQQLNQNHQSALQALQRAKDNALSERNDAQAEIRTMRQALNNSESTIANLNEQIQALHINLNTARSTHNDYALTHLQSALQDAQGQANKLQADYNSLHGLYTKLQETNTALTTSYNNAERERTEIQSKYNQLLINYVKTLTMQNKQE